MKDTNQPRDIAAERQQAVKKLAEGIRPMEPRILLDGTLDLSADLDHSADLLFAVAGALDAQKEELDRIFDGVENAFEQHIAGSDDTYDENDPEGATDKLFNGIRESLDSVLNTFESNISSFVDAEGQVLINALNDAVIAEHGANAGFFLDPGGLGITGDILFDFDVLADRDAFNDRVANNLLNSSLSEAELATVGDTVATALLDHAESKNVDLFTVELTAQNRADGRLLHDAGDSSLDAEGNRAVFFSAFNDDLRINPTTFNGAFTADDPNATFAVPVSDFDFDSRIQVRGDEDGYTLFMDSFDISEFTIGGRVVDLGFIIGTFPDGAVEGTLQNDGRNFPVIVNTWDIAEIKFDETGLDGLQTTTVYNFADDNARAASTITEIAFASEIKEADLSDDANTFEPTTPGTDYRLSELNFREPLLLNFNFFFTPTLQPVTPVAFSTGNNVGNATGDQITSSFDGQPEGNLLALLNDPAFLLQGIDYILEGADLAIDTVLDSISLPIIGNNLSTSFTVLDDLRFDAIAPAIAFSQTPGDDGSTPTTTELLDGFVNDQINDVLGTSNVTYLQTALETPVGSLENSFLFGNLGFSKELFSTELDVGFDLGIPGFDIDFADGTPFTFSAFADVNLGFGVDSQGFFLLNDQDLAEAAVTFVVDGGDFEGSFTIGDALTVDAFAIADPLSLAAGVFSARPDFANGERGDLSVTAALQADLYADLGEDQTRDLSAIDITRGDGTEVVFESIVRIAELAAAPIASVSVNAAADINLQLDGVFTDPSTGDPIPGLPNFATDVVIDKFISSSNDPQLQGVSGASAGGNTINLVGVGAPPLVEVPDLVLFHNMRVDVSDVFDNIISPVLSPLQDVFDPLGDLIDFIDRFPLNEAIDAAESAVPLLGLITQLGNVSDNVDAFLAGDFVNDGFVNLGSFEVLTETYIPPVGLPAVVDANLGIGATGLSIDLPIITDINNFLQLMRGNYAQVDLITATLTAIDIDVEVSLRDEVLDTAKDLPGMPDELVDALADLGGFNATLDALAKAAFTVGYDLSGVVSFVETQDPTRVLDGVFLDASSDVVTLDLDASIGVSVDGTFLGTGVDGSLTGTVSGDADLQVFDPNGDGKLRLNELDEVLDGVNLSSFRSFAEAFFDGSLSVSVGFNVEASFSAIGFDLADFDEDFFDFTISINANDDNPVITPVLHQQLQGGTVIANVGSRVGQSFLNANDGINVQDPDNVEQITIFDFESGTANDGRYQLSYTFNDQNGNPQNFSEEIGSDALILSLGNGVNTLVMKDVRVVDTLIFAGNGLQAIDKDPLDVSTNISLSNSGFHVVFGGNTGNHIVNENPAATGTYWIFGGAGQDNIQITSSDALIFGEDTFGFQEAFAEEFKDGNFNEANARALMVKHLGTLGFTVDDTLDPDAQFDAAMALFAAAYTQATQISGSDGQDRIGVGNSTTDAADTAFVFAGRGSDIVTVQSSVEQANVYLGAGNDLLNVSASGSFVEGGAGSDRIIGGAGDDIVFGYGKALGKDGTTSDGNLNALANRDGNDAIFGEGGNDQLFGQRGNNLIEGGGGNDSIGGGRGHDLIAGGSFNTDFGDGAISRTDLTLDDFKGQTIKTQAPTTLNVLGIEFSLFEDGNDDINSFAGDDIVIGGQGDDEIEATSGRNVLIGDFADIAFTNTGIVTAIGSTQLGSASNGRDDISGGTGVDIIVGGGGLADNTSFTFRGDTLRDTSGLNILIGDDANINLSDAGDNNLFDDAVKVVAVTGAGADSGDNIFASGSDGFDIVVGGEGGDQLRTSMGGNVVLADLGTIDMGLGTITSAEADATGEDSVGMSSGRIGTDRFATPNLFIAGGGADVITGTTFDDLGLADSGTITFDGDVFESLKGYVPISVFDTANDAVVPQERFDAEDAAKLEARGLIVSMISDGRATDGNDVFGLAGGDNMLIAGGGSDGRVTDEGVVIENNGIGGNSIFVLDSGEIDIANTLITSTSNEFSGDDIIQINAGRHIVLGGDGSDRIELGRTEFTSRVVSGGTTTETIVVPDQTRFNGDGDHSILGDNGTITFNVDTFGASRLESVASERDGNDTLQAFQNTLETSPVAGQGNLRAILGGGDDTIQLGNGNNTLIADSGIINVTAGAMSSNLPTPDGGADPASFAGDDVIHLGHGNNRLIAGGGSDEILLDGMTIPVADDEGVVGPVVFPETSGTQAVLADGGQITWNPSNNDFLLMQSGDPTFEGDDVVLAGNGDNRIILGGNLDIVQSDGEVVQGLDTLTIGDGNNFIIGDTGTIDFANQSLTGENNSRTGVDEITGGAGNNLVIGGSEFDDLIFARNPDGSIADSSNAVLGDNGVIEYDAANGNAVTFMRSDFSADDRSDEIKLGKGDNFVIGGHGTDFIDVGDFAGPDRGTGSNIILGDSGQIDLSSDFNPDVGFAESFVRSNSLVSGDRITVSNFISDAIVLGGSGDDRITLRPGTHAVLGDHGTITFDAATQEVLVVNGKSVDGDGNDTVVGPTDGSRDFFVALGGGDDVLSTTNNAIALGDGGVINLIDNFVESDDSGAGDGSDRLSAGRSLGGMLIGGGGDDTFDGQNARMDAIGDSGRIDFVELPIEGSLATQLSATRLEAFDRDNDGNDTFTLDRVDLAPEDRTSRDHNVILGGGSDTVTAGDGNNRIIGDGGLINLTDFVMTGASTGTAGDDIITVGDGDNEIIGGAGNDSITVGNGNNDILGDDGFISLRTSSSFSMNSTNLDTDGADSITAGSGTNRVILGGNDDVASFGDGNNQIIGDGGEIDARVSGDQGELSTDSRDIATAIDDGDDQITVGFGSNMIIGGAGADTITAAQVAAGETAPVDIGDNAIVTSLGVITFATATAAAQSLASVVSARDGRDSVLAGAGDDSVILGADRDRATLGDGANTVLGDDGTIDLLNNSITAADGANTDLDIIVTGSGADVVAGGGAGDRLTVGEGNNIVLGDHGSASFDASANAQTVTAISTTTGGADILNAGNGNNIALLGDDADTANLGTGNNVVLGDGGTVIATTGLATSATNAQDGADTITALTGDNIIAGGGDDDRISVGNGNNAILGDAGTVDWNVATNTFNTLSVTGTALDGADSITAGTGNNVMILGGGGDNVSVTGGNDAIITDTGTINLNTGVITGTSEAFSGADTVTAANGDNLIVTGAGEDRVTVGNGDNAILTDNGTINYNTASGAAENLRSNFDIRDGADSVTAGTGDNDIILGGSGDSISVTGGSDIILSDFGFISVTGGSAVGQNGTTSGGADSIAALNGDNIIIAGENADSVTVGTGNNAIAADLASVTFNTTTRAAEFVSATAVAQDGTDSITAGAGNNAIVGGGFADTVSVSGGNDIILGDFGTIDLITGDVTSKDTRDEGADSITATTGDNIIVAGGDADRIDVGTGNNAILSDGGTVAFDAATRAAQTLTSAALASDSTDSVTAGTGNNAIILGGDDDAISVTGGADIIVTDSGSINLTTGLATQTSDSNAGNDSVTAADGNNIILTGGFEDDIAVGNGSNAILTDTGTVAFDAATRAAQVLTSAADSRDRFDSVTAGTGNNSIILGGDDDAVSVTGGVDIIVADSGSINLTTGTVTHTSDDNAGNDSITAADGDNIILGGAFEDDIAVGNGNNAILTDIGTINYDLVTGAVQTIISATDARDGSDSVTAGTGNNAMVLGGDDDQVNVTGGDDIIVTDSGSINLTTGIATQTSDANAGNDSVTAADGDNIILTGAFEDDVAVGNGNNAILTATGTVTFNTANRVAQVLTSAADARDSFDSVTAGTGNNAIILGGDDDAVSVTGGVDIIVADSGSIDLTTGTVTQTSDDNAGNDSITVADGDNIILGGAFEDDITVGNGNNAILTDIGTVNYDVNTGAQQTIISATDARDGEDSVTAGTGNNAMVLGGDTDQVSVTGGDDIIVTDSGSIDLTNGLATQTSDANAGNDTVTAADGDNIILTGAFEDRIVVGNGDNAILTETGTVAFDASNRQAQILTSAFDSRDSSDSVTAGNGDNWVVLGGASDTGSFGNGDNIVLGDSGLINDIASGQRVAQTTDEGTGAADSITVVAGADVVMAGDGADSVLATGGNNFITGDSGATTLTASVPTNEVLSFASRAADIGDGDTIVTAAGIDVIVAGTGNDSVDSGGGNDIVAGDWVSITTPAGGGGSGTILSTDVGVVGQDSIVSGSANDIVIGGGDSDEINVGTGFDTGIGDNAQVTYVNSTDINALVLTELGLGASDTITAEGTGDNLLIGQFGADTLTGGVDRDVMVGDLATFGFLPFGTNGLTGSHIDRLVDIVFIRPDIGFDDVLIGNEGNDFLLAGFGNDQAFGGDGQDLLAGDDFDISIVYELDAAGEPETQNLFFESNFPTTGGGFDNLDPGDGPDIVVGGLGPDAFNANTLDDFLAGDAVALFLQAPFTPSGGLNAAPIGQTPVAPFNLIQVNFPGTGDLLSTSQVSSSLGFDLDNFGAVNDEDTGIPAINALIASGLTGDDLIERLSSRASQLFDLLQATVTSQQSVEQIAQLLQLDIPQDVLIEMLQNGLSEQIAEALEGELTPLDRYILLRLVEEVVQPALLAAAA